LGNIASHNTGEFQPAGSYQPLGNYANINSPTFTGIPVAAAWNWSAVQGTAPFGVVSNTVVTNLNADFLDGCHASSFATAAQGTLATNAIPNSTFTAVNDFIIGTGASTYAKKTVAQTQTILGLGTAAYNNSGDFATSAQGTLATNAVPKSTFTAVNDFIIGTGSSTFTNKTIAQTQAILGLGTMAYLPAANYATVASPTFTGTPVSPAFNFSAAQGTAPFGVVSNTAVPGLNADFLDGYHATAFATFAQGNLADNSVQKGTFTTLNDFLVGTGAGTYAKKTPVELQAILGLGNAAFHNMSDFGGGTSDSITQGSVQLFCNTAEKLSWNGKADIGLVIALGGG
jgi:hypothetical protein